MAYRRRTVDLILEKKLLGKGAVVIEGPKWCGKTTTAEQVAKSVLYMATPNKVEQNRSLSEINPQLLLEGDTPRLIDEWQIAPKLWDAVRFEVDHRKGVGHFILTGSAVPASTEDIQHTGTGRFAWLTMRPMSLSESGESNGGVSLGDLFTETKDIAAVNSLSLTDIAYLTCRGGWPDAVDMREDIALEQAYDYLDAVVKSDISRVDNVNRDEERAKRLMRSYARHQGSQVAIAVIGADISANEVDVISEQTISSYIQALKKIFVIEDMKAWSPNLRSKTAVRTSDTRYFVDPSIACAALGLGPQDLINDLESFGFLFETLCVRDLRVYAEYLGGNVYHYRDKNGLECDAVVHLRNGSYGLIEIKLGGDKAIEEGVKTLNAFAEKIDTSKMKEPSFKMILIATGDYAYRRSDGIYIVPIGCLKE
ncbi:MAG: ATP-binding protein [Rikenellaceae bacterium]